MDPNFSGIPPVGFILFSLIMVLLLAAIVFALGAWGAAKMHKGRVDESTPIPYPDRPQSADDRRTVRQARAAAASSDRVVSNAQLGELAVGADRKVTPQTPTRAERPVDAADRDKDLHQLGPQSAEASSPAGEQGQGGKSPL